MLKIIASAHEGQGSDPIGRKVRLRLDVIKSGRNYTLPYHLRYLGPVYFIRVGTCAVSHLKSHSTRFTQQTLQHCLGCFREKRRQVSEKSQLLDAVT